MFPTASQLRNVFNSCRTGRTSGITPTPARFHLPALASAAKFANKQAIRTALAPRVDPKPAPVPARPPESARERKNRLARERRAQRKQDISMVIDNVT